MATQLIAETNEDGYSAGTDEQVNPATGAYGIFYLGRFDGVDHDGGWIFRGTTIPQGSMINSCTITLNMNFADSHFGTLAGDVFGYAVDSPADFNAAHTERVSDHEARTSASVSWSVPNASPTTSPSLVSIAQEIVNRPGFSGDLGFTWRNTGGTDAWYPWADYSGSTVNCALLTITWTPPASGKALLWTPQRHMQSLLVR